MNTALQFFLPFVEVHEQEDTYAKLAKLAGRAVPSSGERLYSITYKHDGKEWTATVGERLHGHTIADSHARAKKNRIQKSLGDSAVVVAIFPGVPFLVFTDSGQGAGSRSAWENPFMAGQPTSVTYFRHAK